MIDNLKMGSRTGLDLGSLIVSYCSFSSLFVSFSQLVSQEEILSSLQKFQYRRLELKKEKLAQMKMPGDTKTFRAKVRQQPRP